MERLRTIAAGGGRRIETITCERLVVFVYVTIGIHMNRIMAVVATSAISIQNHSRGARIPRLRRDVLT
jgi:hypothetical protein